VKPIQQHTSNHYDCETIHRLIPAYSVQATDAEETRLVEAHLKNCPEAVAELKDYHAVADKLLYSIPPVQAPTHLGDQLMADIAQRSLHHDALPEVRLVNRETFRARIKHTFEGMKTRAYAFAALILILLLASNLYWFNQMAAVQQTQAQMNALLHGHTAVLALVGAGKTQRIELQNVGEAAGRAILLCDPDEDVGFVYGEDFPALPSSDVYQVWLVREDQRRMNAGVLQIDDQGEGTLIFQFSEPLRDFDAIEITREPISGSLYPSSTLLMQAALVY